MCYKNNFIRHYAVIDDEIHVTDEVGLSKPHIACLICRLHYNNINASERLAKRINVEVESEKDNVEIRKDWGIECFARKRPK